MQIIQLYEEYGVDFLTEGHKHCRPGWVNTPCPFCIGNPGYHLGYNTFNDHFYCWRCGWHAVLPTIKELLNVNIREAIEITKTYGGVEKAIKIPQISIGEKEYKLPSNVQPLQQKHKKYLEKRAFDPDYLEKQWLLMSTGPTSVLDKIDYKHRIIIPIIWNMQEATFQGRDFTDKSPYKYKACPISRERIHHKYIVYGKQEKWRETGICVEGVTDVWRLGVFSFATFGIEYTSTQLRLIAKTFKRVPICFDDDPQAIKQANKLAAELRFRGVDSFRVHIRGDPGSLEQNEAEYLVKQLI